MKLKLFSFILAIAAIIASPCFAADKNPAAEFADNLGRQALAIITTEEGNKQEKTLQLQKLFADNVDIESIAKFVLGRNLKSASEAQIKLYMQNYRDFIIKHYTANLAEFKDADFEVGKVSKDERGGYVVTMRIKRPQAQDVIVDYTIRDKEKEGLKVYDITVEGVSMITTQRSEFSSVIEQKGLDYLITTLGERSKQEEATSN
ncbi:MAG: ABC transporter substrate-binding protein [Pseudomonadota bacterium]